MNEEIKQELVSTFERNAFEKLKEFEARGINTSKVGWFSSLGMEDEEIKKMENKELQ